MLDLGAHLHSRGGERGEALDAQLSCASLEHATWKTALMRYIVGVEIAMATEKTSAGDSSVAITSTSGSAPRYARTCVTSLTSKRITTSASSATIP